ncbi:MAG: site-2 protease family protein, partial [Chloroflexota bacterium]
GLGVALGIVISILIHEMAHALIGSWLGAKVIGIRLHVLGGVTFFSHKPPSYFKDMLISLAGPASNIALWQICELGAKLVIKPVGGVDLSDLFYILLYLSIANLFLGIFNALPGFPLDGGQALYALVRWVTRREKLSAGIVMVLGCVSAFGIVYVGTDGFNFSAGLSNLINLIFTIYIAYWIASSSIALYKQAVSPIKPSLTPRQQAELRQREAEKLSKNRPGYAAFEEGKSYLLSKEYKHAVESFTQALQIEPTDLDYLDYRAYALSQMGDYRRALEDYNRLIEKAPRRTDFYTSRAMVNKNMGYLEAARADIEQALKINPAEGYAMQLKQELAAL